MKIVIIGGGKVGSTIAGQLTKEGHDIVVVDGDRRVLEEISDTLDVMAICGNGSSVAVLREAGAGESDLLIACTGQDELNLICCMFAKKLGCQNTIARVRSPEYYEQVYLIKDEMGLSMIINPELTAAQEIFRLMEFPGVLKRDTFAHGRIEIVELVPKPGDVFDGTKLYDLSKKLKCKALVCAVARGDEVFIPDGSLTLAAGDRVYICAPATAIVKLLHSAGEYKKRVRDVMLIGGSRVAEYLSVMLLKTGTRIKIIEPDEKKARRLAELLPEAGIICADSSSEGVLKSEGVERMDSVVAMTRIDEENLILSLYISRLGVPQVITEINHTEFGGMLMDRGVDRVVSPKKLCANAIIRYVRAMQNTDGSSVAAMNHLVDGKVDALEFYVTPATKNLGRTLKEIRLKPNILVACINRKGRIIVPGGNDTLESGDTVVVVTTAERVVLDLNDIFAAED
ncbi:MAG: Trk system potassium transporter TrkA [Butyricicoccus sp.]|nr:Trk system potassium transporter TrkA [Butyricicoccus sp.]